MRKLTALFLMLSVAGAAAAQNPEPEPISDPAWAELQSYEGVWLSDVKTRPDGSALQFRLSLTSFDRHERIYELVIEMLPGNGDESVLWHGYKGWDPVEEQIYYFAASPLGRHSEGHVHLDDAGGLVTAYTGIDQIRGAVEVRDVFIRIDEDHFNSTSYFHRDGEWQEMLSDEWTRSASG